MWPSLKKPGVFLKSAQKIAVSSPSVELPYQFFNFCQIQPPHFLWLNYCVFLCVCEYYGFYRFSVYKYIFTAYLWTRSQFFHDRCYVSCTFSKTFFKKCKNWVWLDICKKRSNKYSFSGTLSDSICWIWKALGAL